MTIGHLKHLKSLVKRSKKTELDQFKWAFVGKGMSVCATAFLFALGLIISQLVDGGFSMPNWMLNACGVVIVSSIALFITFFLINLSRKKEWEQNYVSLLDEVLELIPDTEQDNVTR